MKYNFKFMKNPTFMVKEEKHSRHLEKEYTFTTNAVILEFSIKEWNKTPQYKVRIVQKNEKLQQRKQSYRDWVKPEPEPEKTLFLSKTACSHESDSFDPTDWKPCMEGASDYEHFVENCLTLSPWSKVDSNSSNWEEVNEHLIIDAKKGQFSLDKKVVKPQHIINDVFFKGKINLDKMPTLNNEPLVQDPVGKVSFILPYNLRVKLSTSKLADIFDDFANNIDYVENNKAFKINNFDKTNTVLIHHNSSGDVETRIFNIITGKWVSLTKGTGDFYLNYVKPKMYSTALSKDEFQAFMVAHHKSGDLLKEVDSKTLYMFDYILDNNNAGCYIIDSTNPFVFKKIGLKVGEYDLTNKHKINYDKLDLAKMSNITKLSLNKL